MYVDRPDDKIDFICQECGAIQPHAKPKQTKARKSYKPITPDRADQILRQCERDIRATYRKRFAWTLADKQAEAKRVRTAKAQSPQKSERTREEGEERARSAFHGDGASRTRAATPAKPGSGRLLITLPCPTQPQSSGNPAVRCLTVEIDLPPSLANLILHGGGLVRSDLGVAA
jgi:hypothetical protein